MAPQNECSQVWNPFGGCNPFPFGACITLFRCGMTKFRGQQGGHPFFRTLQGLIHLTDTVQREGLAWLVMTIPPTSELSSTRPPHKPQDRMSGPVSLPQRFLGLGPKGTFAIGFFLAKYDLAGGFQVRPQPKQAHPTRPKGNILADKHTHSRSCSCGSERVLPTKARARGNQQFSFWLT